MENKFLNRDNFFLTCLLILIISNTSVFYLNFLKHSREQGKTKETIKEFSLLPGDQINSVTYLSIKNRFGLIEFLKESPSPFPWLITSHQNLLAETKKIKSLLTNLQGIKVKRQIKADQISIKNYSLDNPFLELSYLLSGQNISKLKIGLINDLKKVAYIQFGNSNTILEVTYRSLNFFDNNFSSFTSNYPLNFIDKNASKIELHNGPKHIFTIQKVNNVWISEAEKNQKLNNEKIMNWLEELSKIKNEIILDKITEQQKNILENSKQVWRRSKLVVHTSDEKIYEYDFYSTPNILEKENKKQDEFVLIDKYRAFPIILNQDAKKLLNITLRSF